MNAEISVKTHNLPVYSKGEEVLNVCSHTVGVFLGIGMIATVSMFYQNTLQLASGILFGWSLIILYAMSCTYHGLCPKNEPKTKKYFS
jgi:hemolysin III